MRTLIARPTNLARLLVCGAIGAVLAVAGCGSDSDDSDETSKEPPGLLYVQPATGGTLEREGNGFLLTLSGVDPSVTFFSDRPERIAGQLPAEAFAEIWDRAGFKEDPPNAALTIAGAHPDADVFVLELEQPRFVASGNRVSYRATPVTEVGQTAAQKRLDPIARAPATFGSASLLIDDVPAAETADATAQQLATTAASLRDPGGSPRLSSLIAGLQAKSDRLAPLASRLKQGSSGASTTSSLDQLTSDMEQLTSAMAAEIDKIHDLIEQLLKQSPGGVVDRDRILNLQLRMQTISELLAAVSHTFYAVRSTTAARASRD